MIKWHWNLDNIMINGIIERRIIAMRRALEKNVGLIIYLAVWAALFCWFWMGSLTGNEAIYSLGAFYVLLPVSAMVVSVMYGMGRERIRYVVPVILEIGRAHV